MPGFDGTGPRGQGAMTGRGMGYCVVALNGAGNRLGNNGGFYGRGRRRGFRNCFYSVKNQLENMQARIQNLEEKKGAN
jgi:hypothetical protein